MARRQLCFWSTRGHWAFNAPSSSLRSACRAWHFRTTTPSFSSSLKTIPRLPSSSSKTVGREIAVRFHRIVDRSFTQAVRDTDRADQGTCSAGSEGHARDRRASQDGRYQGIRPAHLSLPLQTSAFFAKPGLAPGLLAESMSTYGPS
jgi:hypothetical protein